MPRAVRSTRPVIRPVRPTARDDDERLGLGQDWIETFHGEVLWATGQRGAAMVERLAGQVEANPSGGSRGSLVGLRPGSLTG